MKIKEVVTLLESWAPPSFQVPYDNSGLIIGEKSDEIHAALITLDVTEKILDEAIANGNDLIIAHHPLIFKGIKRIGKRHWIDKCIRKAIQNNIAIYAIHTNLDNVLSGVNKKIANKLGLINSHILQPKASTLSKLSFFVPNDHREKVLEALFDVGAGSVGNYDQCSFQTEGIGTFRGNEHSTPTIGSPEIPKSVAETKVEVLVPQHIEAKVINTMQTCHPYEEVAYYLSELKNKNQEVGAGMVGELPNELTPNQFISHLKKSMNLEVVKCTDFIGQKLKKVALCGGSGQFLLKSAIGFGADVFISADFKYHDYFEANNEITIVDIGHYESEIFTKELLHDELSKTFTRFAFHLSKVDTNPIKYL